MSDLFDSYPYAERFGVNRELPEAGRPREEILGELREMATEEDAFWETGSCSGTMYCGDHDHYAFLNEAFGLFAHQNALQRDMCPSATKFEGEIIAMALDLMHAGRGRRRASRQRPAGMVTTGGTGSILHALLAYREQGRRGARRSTGRTWSSPRPGTPPSTRPATCSASSSGARRSTRRRRWSTRRRRRSRSTTRPIAIIGSACNYGYGTIDPIAELAELALDRGVGLHVDGCLGGFILPFGEELGYDIPPFDFRVPGVTSISADTHKYGYAFKGTSIARSSATSALRNAQYFFLPDWSGGKYCSPGMEGSRSGGLLAATWASMVSLGREGYLRYAQARSSRPSAAMQDGGALAPRAADPRASRRSASASPRTSSTSTT